MLLLMGFCGEANYFTAETHKGARVPASFGPWRPTDMTVQPGLQHTNWLAGPLGQSKRLFVMVAVVLFCSLHAARTLDVVQANDKNPQTAATAAGQPADLKEAEALLALSEQQNFQNHAIALQTAQKALALWETLGNNEGMARSYGQVGRCYFAQDALSEAVENYEKALKIWRDLNNQREQAGTLIMLGYIEDRRGEWRNAIALLTQAQQLVNERDDPYRMGQIASGLADVFNESGSPENGIIQYQRALEFYGKTSDMRDDALTIAALGRTYYLSKNYPEALSHLQQALNIVVPNSLDSALCDEYLGRVYSAMNEDASALKHYESALLVYMRTVNPNDVADMRALMGQVYQRQEKLALARKFYQLALSTFTQVSDRINQAAVYYALGRLELKAGNLDRAEDALRKSIEVTENIRQVPSSTDLTAAFSATVHERYEAYIDCLMRKHRSKPLEGLDVRAFETNELSRARALRELLRATQTNLVAGLDPQLAAQEKELRQLLRVKENSKVALLATKYKKEDLDALEFELARLDREYKQVTDTIRARYPSYERITRPTTLSLKQIQEQVLADDQTLLLEYSFGRDKSYVWAVTRTEFSSYELPGREQIEDAARRLYKSLTASQPEPGESFEQGQARALEAKTQLSSKISALSKIVLAPVADKLGTKRLLIVADGTMQYVPFQVLSVAAQPSAGEAVASSSLEERLLIFDHEIISEPSASTLALVLSESANRKPAPKSVAILADPVFDVADSRIKSPNAGSLLAAVSSTPGEVMRALRDVGVNDAEIPRLISSRDEAEAIMSVIPWRTGFKAVDFEANRATAIGSDLGQYRVVHFATHALLNNEHPELSGIVLSLVDQKGQRQDGFLRLPDIYNLKLPVDLVVLSACQTGLGKDVKGEGLIGLTRGFMYAGASGVVASLWKVDDEATAELMKYFYEGLFEKGLSPSAALREAQLTMRQQKRWQEPYYWAGFVIQGQYANRGRSSYQLTPAVKLAVSGGALGLSFAVILVLWRRRRRNL